jgi:DNA-binding NtrC family response regulator
MNIDLIINKPIDEVFSSRIVKALNNAGILNLYTLTNKNSYELLKIKGLGRVGLTEILYHLESIGLNLKDKPGFGGYKTLNEYNEESEKRYITSVISSTNGYLQKVTSALCVTEHELISKLLQYKCNFKINNNRIYLTKLNTEVS